MSITTWKGHDRLAADAAINLNYNVLWFTVKNRRDEKGITVLECYKCLITRQRYGNFLLTKKIWKEKAVKLP